MDGDCPGCYTRAGITYMALPSKRHGLARCPRCGRTGPRHLIRAIPWKEGDVVGHCPIDGGLLFVEREEPLVARCPRCGHIPGWHP